MTYVLDVESMKFKNMIRVIELNNGKKDIQFMFWPSNSDYLVGSFNSQTKGYIVSEKIT